MQAEMNKLFAEGGVMQEGGTVDPVSGNDVPVGSMQEEVRDDIPAQLSEGEFVIPADVVRYIGLEKLMMLRDKAKAGLKRMEEIGQMGNAEEVPDGEALFGGSEDEMDDDAFSSEIESIMSEDDGGKEREYAKGGDVRKYAPGGYVGGEANQQLYRDAPVKGFEMVPMTNDSGQTIYIPFINGVAQLSIPAGYKVKAAGATAATTGVGRATDSAGGGDNDGVGRATDSAGGGDNDGGAPSAPAGPNISMTPEGPVANTVNPAIGSFVGAVLGTVLGLPPSITSQIGKSAINQINFTADQAAMNVSVAQADTSNPANLEGITTAAATPTAPGGAQGTGGAAASAASAAAAAASAAGHSAAAIGAASQAAADATVSGADAAAAAAAAADAANAAAADAADAEGGGIGTAATGGVGGVGVGASDGSGTAAGEGTGGVGVGDSGDGGTGAASSAGGDGAGASAGDGSGPGSGDGDGGYAKGGFVSKRKDKKTGKATSFVTRQK